MKCGRRPLEKQFNDAQLKFILQYPLRSLMLSSIGNNGHTLQNQYY